MIIFAFILNIIAEFIAVSLLIKKHVPLFVGDEDEVRIYNLAPFIEAVSILMLIMAIGYYPEGAYWGIIISLWALIGMGAAWRIAQKDKLCD